ncbi:hypothetical protein ZWY2020_048545 [Hordeum vulgare]|nr:hypothetical protein ZWY2020_048545 [Hordeum vulgare]
MHPFICDPTVTVTTSPKTQGQEEEGLGADPSFNSSYTESVGVSPEAQCEDGTAATQANDEAESRVPGSPSLPRQSSSISSRRDAIRAGCFRRLAASCEAARICEAALFRESKPPAAKAEDPDEPIWPPKSRHWRHYVYVYLAFLPNSPLAYECMIT